MRARGWAWSARRARLGVSELAELGLPAGLEVAGDEPVLGLAGVKRAFGTRGVVAGALDTQLERPVRARAAVCNLVRGGERDRDLLRRERRKERRATSSSTPAALTDRQPGGLDVVQT